MTKPLNIDRDRLLEIIAKVNQPIRRRASKAETITRKCMSCNKFFKRLTEKEAE